jgi:hypothetical protein
MTAALSGELENTNETDLVINVCDIHDEMDIISEVILHYTS